MFLKIDNKYNLTEHMYVFTSNENFRAPPGVWRQWWAGTRAFSLQAFMSAWRIRAWIRDVKNVEKLDPILNIFVF